MGEGGGGGMHITETIFIIITQTSSHLVRERET